MSFASSKEVIETYSDNLSQLTLPSGILQLMFDEVLPKGTYFLTYSPLITATDTIADITCWIGSNYNTLTENEVASIYVRPAGFHNDEYFTPAMSGTYVSNGVDSLVIRLTCVINDAGTYNAFAQNNTSYDFNYIRLS
jgi:hypothetical protein